MWKIHSNQSDWAAGEGYSGWIHRACPGPTASLKFLQVFMNFFMKCASCICSHSKEPGPHHPPTSYSFSSLSPFFKWWRHKVKVKPFCCFLQGKFGAPVSLLGNIRGNVGGGGCPGKGIKVPAVENRQKLPKTGLNCPVSRLQVSTVHKRTHKHASWRLMPSTMTSFREGVAYLSEALPNHILSKLRQHDSRVKESRCGAGPPAAHLLPMESCIYYQSHAPLSVDRNEMAKSNFCEKCILMERVIPSLRGVFCVQSGELDVCRYVSSSIGEVKMVPSVCISEERLCIWVILVRIVGDLCHGSLLLFTWRGGTLSDGVQQTESPNDIVLNPGFKYWIMDMALLLLIHSCFSSSGLQEEVWWEIVMRFVIFKEEYKCTKFFFKKIHLYAP